MIADVRASAFRTAWPAVLRRVPAPRRLLAERPIHSRPSGLSVTSTMVGSSSQLVIAPISVYGANAARRRFPFDSN
jgi:hypothetical protein